MEEMEDEMTFDESFSEVGGKAMTLDGSNVGYHRERVEAWARGDRIAPVFMDVATKRELEQRVLVCARCVGCGAERDIKPNDIAADDQPMCEQCFMPMIARLAAHEKKRKGKR